MRTGSRRHRISTVFQIPGRRADSLRIGRYTNFLDITQVFPSTGSLVRLAGAVMCEQDEIWQESRYFSEVRMNELYDDGRTQGIDGPVEWARLEAEARKMLESGLELADRVEAA